MGTKPLKVLQCNVAKCYASHHEALKHFMSSDISIALLSEPYVGNSDEVHNIEGVHVFQFTGKSRVKACVLIKQDISAILGLHQYSSPNLSAVRIKLQSRNLTIASGYIEPDDDSSDTLQLIDKLMKDHQNSHCLIGMDCNGSSPLWGCEDSDSRGEDIERILSSSNFFTSNSGQSPTFEAVRHKKYCSSIVDITLASEQTIDKISDWKVDKSICPTSDHNAITFSLGLTPEPSGLRSSTYYFNNKTAKWDLFSKELQKNMTSSGLLNVDLNSTTKSDLDSIVLKLTDTIRKACQSSMKIRGNQKPYNPWWTEELERMKKSVIKQHHHLHNLKVRGLPTSEAAEVLQSLKQKYSKSIRKESSANFRSFCQKQGKEDVWTLTNRLIKDAPSQRPPSTLKTPNSFTESSEQTARALLQHFYPDDSPDVCLSQQETRAESSQIPDSDDDPPFTTEEVLECIKTMNPNRAPGHDNLTSDICQQSITMFPNLFTNLFNRCLELGHFPKSWKEARVKILPKPGRADYSDLGSYRPIGLLPVLGKLLEKLFTKRITYSAQTLEVWSPDQYGFREQTTTTDALKSIIDKVQNAKSKKQQVIGVSLDIKSAFDNAWWPLLLQRLRRTGCPRNMFVLIQSYLQDRTATLDYSDSRVSKSLSRGCVQGSICGPTFWNIILDDLLESSLPDGCNIQAFADDVFLTVSGKSSSEVEVRTNQALNIIKDWGERVKLTFSPSKTQAIAFTPGSKSVSLIMDGTEIPISPTLKLLGVMLDSNLNFIQHAKYAIQKAKKVFNSLCKFVRPTWGVHPSNVESIYKHVIQPMITYAAGIWGRAAERTSVKRLLTSFQRSFAIRAIRGFHTVSAASASALAQFVPLHLKVREVHEIERVKMTGLYSGLPDDASLENRARPKDLLHPSARLSIIPSTANNQEQADSNSSPTNIYTDGSKLETDDVGSAFVVHHPSGRVEPKKYRLGTYCTVFQAELLALDQAVHWIELNATTDVTIFSDSLSSIQAIQNRSNTHPLVHSIHQTLNRINDRIKVRFSWVKAHVGIQGNELADSAAKTAAVQKRAQAYVQFPLSYAKHRIKQETMDLWQTEYSESDTGSTTKSFFPSLKSIQQFRTHCEPSFEMTQILTGHGFHLQYLKRFKVQEREACPCGEAVQDVHHLLKSCPKYARPRMTYEGYCSEEGVHPYDLQSIAHKPHLIPELTKLVTSIVRTLKSFNSQA
jgi:ribonuclease HI